MSDKRQKARGERLMGKGGLKFKELRVWQKRKDLAVYVYQISKKKLFRR
ncbi:MAG: hypothetical protein WBD09_07390 [Halobacteriota archaeon]